MEKWVSAFGLSSIYMTNGECSPTAASLGGSVAQAEWVGPKVGGHPALMLYSSNKLGELSHSRSATMAAQ